MAAPIHPSPPPTAHASGQTPHNDRANAQVDLDGLLFANLVGAASAPPDAADKPASAEKQEGSPEQAIERPATGQAAPGKHEAAPRTPASDTAAALALPLGAAAAVAQGDGDAATADANDALVQGAAADARQAGQPSATQGAPQGVANVDPGHGKVSAGPTPAPARRDVAALETAPARAPLKQQDVSTQTASDQDLPSKEASARDLPAKHAQARDGQNLQQAHPQAETPVAAYDARAAKAANVAGAASAQAKQAPEQAASPAAATLQAAVMAGEKTFAQPDRPSAHKSDKAEASASKTIDPRAAHDPRLAPDQKPLKDAADATKPDAAAKSDGPAHSANPGKPALARADTPQSFTGLTHADTPAAPPPPTLAPAHAGAAHAGAPAQAPTPGALPQAPNVAAFASLLARRAQDGGTRFELRLDPPDLGQVKVKLSLGNDGRAQAHLSFDRQDAMDYFSRDARALQRALANSGFDVSDGDLSFSLSDHNPGSNPNSGGFAGNDASSPGYPEPLHLKAPTAPVADFAHMNAQKRGLDIRI